MPTLMICFYPVMGQACTALLTTQELERCRRYKFEKHRQRITGHVRSWSDRRSHMGVRSSEAWRFAENELGKPFLDPDCGLRFNLSNSVGLVVCHHRRRCEVGVDVEAPARFPIGRSKKPALRPRGMRNLALPLKKIYVLLGCEITPLVWTRIQRSTKTVTDCDSCSSTQPDFGGGSGWSRRSHGMEFLAGAPPLCPLKLPQAMQRFPSI